MVPNLQILLDYLYDGPIENVFYFAIRGSYLIGSQTPESDIDFELVLYDLCKINKAPHVPEEVRERAGISRDVFVELSTSSKKQWAETFEGIHRSRSAVEALFIPDDPRYIVMSDDFRENYHMNTDLVDYWSIMAFEQYCHGEYRFNKRLRLQMIELVASGGLVFPAWYGDYLRSFPKHPPRKSLPDIGEMVEKARRIRRRHRWF